MPTRSRGADQTRLDGYIAAPGDRIPAAAAEMIARAMPQPRNSAIAAIRARMLSCAKRKFW